MSAALMADRPLLLVPSPGVRRIITLAPLLDAFRLLPGACAPRGAEVAGVLAWGRKPSARRAALLARRAALPLLSIEDGFLRSYGTGAHFPPLSLVLDNQGIYYDSTGVSALEALLQSPADLLAGIGADVARAKQLILHHRLSKYNHAPLLPAGALRDGDAGRVLVIDQTAGDLSVSLGGASGATFGAMLAAARAEHPRATIYVKTHPEVSAGRKGGYLTAVRDDDRTVVLRGAIDPFSLIEQMDHVYVVTSTMGFEAMLAGKPVTVFGLPWYAGWGSSDDRQRCARRARPRSIDELFAAGYFHYARYLNPVTHERGVIFDVIAWLVQQREMAARQAGRIICVGYRRWKAVNIAPLLSLDARTVTFVKGATAAAALAPTARDRLLYWGRQAPPGIAALARQFGVPALRMEDGFVRSVGLGSDLIRPLSLVLDERGMYFDPGRQSSLEHLLETARFSELDLARARRARAFVVAHGITKYNLEPRAPVTWPSAGRDVVLVTGQVEDDASIRYGCSDVKTNLALLRAARLAHPGAFVVYKPHPDVMAGNRAGKMALAEAGKYADLVETGLSVVSCIDACDVLHTMTSLSGFDALLRGKPVVVYGQPFYAGWGLTQDVLTQGAALARRRRRLTLDQLVAGALLRYPIYWDWDLKGYTSCEAVLHRIVATRTGLERDGGLARLRGGVVRRQWRKLAILARAWTAAL